MSKDTNKEKAGLVTKASTTISKYWKQITTVSKNFSHLVEASALVGTSTYAVWASQEYTFSMQHADKALLFAGVLILIRGMIEFLKTLNKR